MKSIFILSVFLLLGVTTNAQHDVCRMPIKSAWIKTQPTSGYDYTLGDASLENFLEGVRTSKYVYLYYNRNGTWQPVVQCAIPKNFIKTYYFKNGIQYGISTKKEDRPTLITLVKS